MGYADVYAGKTLVHQHYTGSRYLPDAQRIEQRYRCIADRHAGVTFNPNIGPHGATWCDCGRVVRPGNFGRLPSDYERHEHKQDRLAQARRDATQPGRLGDYARAYLHEMDNPR